MKIENFFCDPQSIISDVETTLILEMLISVATWPYCGKQTNFFSKNLKFWKLQLQPEISMGQPSKTNKNWLFCVILKIWSRFSLFFSQKASKLRGILHVEFQKKSKSDIFLKLHQIIRIGLFIFVFFNFINFKVILWFFICLFST